MNQMKSPWCQSSPSITHHFSGPVCVWLNQVLLFLGPGVSVREEENLPFILSEFCNVTENLERMCQISRKIRFDGTEPWVLWPSPEF